MDHIIWFLGYKLNRTRIFCIGFTPGPINIFQITLPGQIISHNHFRMYRLFMYQMLKLHTVCNIQYVIHYSQVYLIAAESLLVGKKSVSTNKK